MKKMMKKEKGVESFLEREEERERLEMSTTNHSINTSNNQINTKLTIA